MAILIMRGVPRQLAKARAKTFVRSAAIFSRIRRSTHWHRHGRGVPQSIATIPSKPLQWGRWPNRAVQGLQFARGLGARSGPRSLQSASGRC